ncbi:MULTISPECIES: KH domain-containing protein [Fusobacterium]|uniref:KH domain-containing protein n=1 Tax=Fusobacterium TaxID=848 RepID=UPI0014776585|nr:MULTISPECIES: KH domain-containing protein [Fusobacterium]NME35752.1 KH domain-containing protein [Fusobacterium sp. FSA-380-WT-3A]
MDIRALEKTNKIGYIFDIFYQGKYFDSFDEVTNKKSVKGQFKNLMNSLGFTWAKGIQQGGRTDAKVSGSNCLYVSSTFSRDIQKIISEFNNLAKGEMKITRYRKTFPNLVFPDYVKQRKYIYQYPKKLITRSEEEIKNLCSEYSGTYDVSIFTDSKGENLKEHIRTVEITYENGQLIFLGDSFMPKQVRITSGFILTGDKTPLPGKYLKLHSIILEDELLNNIFTEVDDLKIDNVEKIEKNSLGDTYLLYVNPSKKGEVIGKNGSNIKKLKKSLGNVIVREYDFI